MNPDELEARLTRLRISNRKEQNEVRRLSETRWTPSRIKFNTRSGFVLVDPNVECYHGGMFLRANILYSP